MKILAASAFLALLPVTAAMAQGAPDEPAPAGTPSCADALPQIVNLVDQAEAAGLETSSARNHVGTAEAAQAAGDEGACIDALVLAQNTVLEQVDTPPS